MNRWFAGGSPTATTRSVRARGKSDRVAARCERRSRDAPSRGEFGEEGFRVGWGERSGEKEPLSEVAVLVAELLELMFEFDAFGDEFEFECVAEIE